jgi:3-methyladenine DNA glycosylase Tag
MGLAFRRRCWFCRRQRAVGRDNGGYAVREFDAIIAMAADRKGGMDALELSLAATPSLAPADIAAMPDDRILAAMTRRIFCAGFSSKVVDAKWDAFETAFDRFDPRASAFMTEEDFDRLLKNPGIVRNGAKVKSVQVNARLILDLAAAHGSAARFFADWPDTDYVGLLDLLKKRASHLGGESAMRFLRAIGKPAFVTATDVIAALRREAVLKRVPNGKGDLLAIQNACNQWSRQSGRNLTEISRILALSVDTQAAADSKARTAKP